MKKVAIDYDDVLVPFLEGFFDWYNEQHNTDFHPKDNHQYALSANYGFTSQYWADRMNEFHSTGLSSRLRPHDGAIEALERLSQNSELVILTSRPSRHRQFLEEWVDSHASAHITEIHMFEGDQKKPTINHEKGAVCKDISAELLIDDNPGYIESAKRHGIEAVLFGEVSWNKEHRADNHYARNWQEVLAHLGYN